MMHRLITRRFSTTVAPTFEQVVQTFKASGKELTNDEKLEFCKFLHAIICHPLHLLKYWFILLF